jgi:MYXO-CTERM domain-containing protein
MPSGLGNSSGGKGGSYPVTYGFAGLVLLALGVLVVLRYFYGSIRVEGGVR